MVNYLLPFSAAALRSERSSTAFATGGDPSHARSNAMSELDRTLTIWFKLPSLKKRRCALHAVAPSMVADSFPSSVCAFPVLLAD